MSSSSKIADFSCSQLKHASLGKSIPNALPVQNIVKPVKMSDLPQVNSTEIVIGQRHNCKENIVQDLINSWLGGKESIGYMIHI